MTKEILDYSIILPLYKQVDHVDFIMDTYTRILKNRNFSYELLLIINGPEDGSYDKARSLAKQFENIQVFKLYSGGWGRAVIHGIKKSSGKAICYTNSARTNPIDLLTFIKIFERNNNCLIKATRIVRESFLRRFGSILYNFEGRLLFKIPIWDINGTPKIMSSKLFKKLKLASLGDIIDAELVAKCVQNNINILEVPVIYTGRISGTSTTQLKSAFNMYKGMYSLWKTQNFANTKNLKTLEQTKSL